ncbi:hypothetical protein THIOM_001706 [Candidatus Thiomargarita nelsonii]|uniref:Uncharacterized protein n=1 Tax=Candidatus Thiomargarita nelsonii TaxID=1003181 RepID=A0A176S3J1_9GAMM|nr:hypothetical protein THIOM_001706 [Candidatus Thiomargarita nelsonii]
MSVLIMSPLNGCRSLPPISYDPIGSAPLKVCSKILVSISFPGNKVSPVKGSISGIIESYSIDPTLAKADYLLLDSTF